MKRFDGQKFLKAHFEGAADLKRLLAAYDYGDVPYETASKWFQRGRVSVDWLPLIISVASLERMQTVDLESFIQ